MSIAAILSAKGAAVTGVAGHVTVAEAVQLLATQRIGALPVVDGDRVLGMFSERDVIHAVNAKGAAALDRPVTEVMTVPAITVGRDEGVLGALALMTRRRIRHLPVVDGDRLVGIVSIGDLVKHRIDQIEADAEAMRQYIQGA